MHAYESFMHVAVRVLHLSAFLWSATGRMANEATGFYKRLASRLASALQLNNVLTTLSAYFLTTLVTYSVHKGCPLQLWSCSQVPDSPIGLGHVWTWLHLNWLIFSYFVVYMFLIKLYCGFIVNPFLFDFCKYPINHIQFNVKIDAHFSAKSMVVTKYLQKVTAAASERYRPVARTWTSLATIAMPPCWRTKNAHAYTYIVYACARSWLLCKRWWRLGSFHAT